MKLKKNSMYFVPFIAVSAFVFIVAGIIAGAVFKRQELISNGMNGLFGSATQVKEHFNTALMFLVWLCGILPISFLFGLFLHLRNQETKNELLKSICLAVGGELEEPAPVSQPYYYAPPTPAAAPDFNPHIAKEEDSSWTCPACGERNPNTNTQCIACGAYCPAKED